MEFSGFPIIEHVSVAHVGDLDPKRKRPCSYEGRCLSVSMVPTAWAEIAKLGDHGYILTGRGRFLNVLALTDDQKLKIVEWALSEGFLQRRRIIRLHTYDSETDEWRYIDCTSMREAKDEAEMLDEGTFRFERTSAPMATGKLARLAGYESEDAVDSDLSFDLALIEFASRNLDVDGVWWEEELDVDALSAPRGAIFPERVADFTVTPATWNDLEDFEARFLCDLEDRHGARVDLTI